MITVNEAEIIAAALRAGATAAANQVADDEVVEAYNALRTALTGAAQDHEILAAAQRLLRLAYPVGRPSAQQPRPIAPALHIGTSYGPAAASMTGPVTVDFGDKAHVPPVSPTV
ncbi:hypothetical protein [Dactylosporangium sp. NPDC049140]|uniref:hypothetical protein n=1 Tax=Dactylosporangium sp. NPDC049140 TaxID=3155647 RepID=UPI0033FABA6F